MSNKLSAKKWMKDQGYQKVMTISLDTLELILNQWDQSKAKAALKEDGWGALNNLVINELPKDSVVLTMMNNRKVFVYDSEHTLKGLSEIQKHHPEALCLVITKPLPQPPTQRVIEGL